MASFIRTYASRIAGALAAVIGAFIVNYGIELAPEALAGLEAFLEAIFLGVGLLLYGLVHKFIDGLMNKDDSSG